MPMTEPLRGISSMATRSLLAALSEAFTRQTGSAVAIESVGGVDAAKRVRAGEAFDLVVLASDAMAKLATDGLVVAETLTPLVHSGVAVAVPAGAPLPDLSTEAGVRQAVLCAPTLGVSTGPSGVQLLALFERWGIAAEVQGKLVQAPPGVPVGALVARCEVALGFQQLSELIHVPGITVVGPLPEAIQINTTFTAGLASTSSRAAAVQAFLVFLASPQTADAKRAQGMVPA